MDELNNKPQLDEEVPEPPELGQRSISGDDMIKPRIHPIAAAIIGLAGGFLLYQLVGGVLTLLIFGFDLKNAPVNSLRLMTIAGEILFILLPALVFSKIFYEDVGHIIRFKFPRIEEIFLFLIGMAVLTPLIQYYLSIQSYLINVWSANSTFIHTIRTLLDKLNKMVDQTYSSLLSTKSILEGLLVIIVVSVVPAICEEVMFRGFIQKSFELKIKPIWAAIITAIFFGIYHFNPYGLIPLIALGLYFGYAAYMSNSIFVPMSLHFVNNFLAVIFFFIFGDDDVINSRIDKDFNLSSTLLIFTGLLILFFGVIYFIRRYYKQENNYRRKYASMP